MIIWKSEPSKKNYLELRRVNENDSDIDLDDDENEIEVDNEEFEFKLNLELDFDFDEEFELKLVEGEEPFNIRTSINKIVESLNGVYFEYEGKDYDYNKREYVAQTFKQVLLYNPILGKTWTGKNTGHIKEADYSSCGDLNKYVALNQIDHTKTSLGVDVIYNRFDNILFLPCKILSLLVHTDVERSVLWPVFLKRMGFLQDEKSKADLPYVTANYILLNFRNSSSGIIIDDAKVANACSLSHTHISISFQKKMWYRMNRGGDISWNLFASSFGNSEDANWTFPKIECLNIEESDYGIATIHSEKEQSKLIDFYNQNIKGFDSEVSKYVSFSPGDIQGRQFVIAIAQIKSGYCWNIYSFFDAQWLFRELLPIGLACWSDNKKLLIGMARQKGKEEINLKQEIVQILEDNRIKFTAVSHLELEISVLTNWIIDYWYQRRRVTEVESEHYRYHLEGPYNISYSLLSPPKSLVRHITNKNYRHDTYRDEMHRDASDLRALEDLNRQGLDEIKGDNGNFSWDL
jgi:hypothetical protein